MLTVRKNSQNGLLLLKTWLRVLSITQLMCGGTSTIHLRLIIDNIYLGPKVYIIYGLIKSSLPSLYPLRHSHDKLFQALYHFSILALSPGPTPKNREKGLVTLAKIPLCAVSAVFIWSFIWSREITFVW